MIRDPVNRSDMTVRDFTIFEDGQPRDVSWTREVLESAKVQRAG
jgi:hypothetical protein